MKWVVNVNGNLPPRTTDRFTYYNPDIGSDLIEISVLRDDNEHGKQSLGWDGPTKVILCSMRPLPPRWLFDDLTVLAKKLADKLNEIDAAVIPSDFIDSEAA